MGRMLRMGSTELNPGRLACSCLLVAASAVSAQISHARRLDDRNRQLPRAW